ncbi:MULTISPECIES: hypothetical protein [unclassified Enterococcus]|nr:MULTISPECIES: hypothetical protein [unclassified Enterococcus]MBS7576524.1 hypothetical protein [Enterococcus sp. MMGLQ5-2]MBS7583989.1 hypothetical protein [Enterococcus sp. MMGLQ5-1]NPD11850.1 hypothetical protein [Enterococcus sp. MMGLQ5-1]NPD36361.1 hypothetical protein [Enterococcus sp. MMGLQ5-2]
MTKAIMLFYNTGMNMNLPIIKMQNAAKEQGIEIKIFAVSSAQQMKI